MERRRNYLRFSRVLGTTPYLHFAVFRLGYYDASLRLKIEMFLATHSDNTAEDVIRYTERTFCITIFDEPIMVKVTFLHDSLLDSENSRQLLILDLHNPGCGFGVLRRIRKYHADRLSCREYFVYSKEGLIARWSAPSVGFWTRKIMVIHPSCYTSQLHGWRCVDTQNSRVSF